MSLKIPYMLAPSVMLKIFDKITEARRLERFTQDFLETKLGQSGGSARPIIPLLKRMGFLASDGTPTSRYDQYRNVHTSKIAIAEGMKEAFSDIFDRNVYAYSMERSKLTALIVEITGSTKDDRTTKAAAGTFTALNDLADFESDGISESQIDASVSEENLDVLQVASPSSAINSNPENGQVDFRVGYTINLNLPETSDPEVFNAIFKSLKEHLLVK